MKKVRYIAGLAGMAPVAVGLITPTAAQATTATTAKTVSMNYVNKAAVPAIDHHWSCFGLMPDGKYQHCNASIVHGPAPFYSPNGRFIENLHDGARVQVTCWYSGANKSGDPYWDHVVREQSRPGATTSHLPGHVADYYVSLGGLPTRLLNPC